MATRMGTLTDTQEHFCQLVAKGESGTAAAKTAGYAEESAHIRASKLLRMDKVRLRVEQLKERITDRIADKTGISKAWVIEQLAENVAMGKQAVPVMNNDGTPTGEYEQNLAAANKALELIGKELGMFVERREVRTGQLDLTDEQLESALAAVRAVCAAQDSGKGARHTKGSQPAAGLSPVREAG